MRLPDKMLASLLVIFSFSTKGAASWGTKVSSDPEVVWGALDHDVELRIPDFSMSDDTEDIRWVREESRVAQFKKDKDTYSLNGTYELVGNVTLKIKQLNRHSNSSYKVIIYNTKGECVLEKTFDLKVQEMVSKPELSWNCSTATLTCEVVRGTDVELTLSLDGKSLRTQQKIITHKWATSWSMTANCTANNRVSEESTVAVANCSDEQQEMRAQRAATEERARKLPPIPASTPANPAAAQPPPPPGHGSQAPGHRPLPPAHRAQHQKQKRPPPSGTQGHQQRGPPLPRPRVQPKPPQGTAESSLAPSSN
ncbi:T-cell surface antigen CD2 isoform X2 [Oryctolagus cuniculus]|uniref:T-cell surface antigen CD2 isoform X2 n=1 Tax=Oryctolagus cuniculus TaxID=9986 RepID=UPI00222F3C2F|nr:T-cell surface antigen CD2 isoform X2 [Oryctolagus cuniculus]